MCSSGVPCEIQSIEKDIIKCQTNEALQSTADNVDFYAGEKFYLNCDPYVTMKPFLYPHWGYNNIWKGIPVSIGTQRRLQTSFWPNFTGNRGLLREVWNRTSSFSVSGYGGLRKMASEVLPEASSTSFSDRLRGFFVPPSDNNYTFFIQTNHRAELYLSINESAKAKVNK